MGSSGATTVLLLVPAAGAYWFLTHFWATQFRIGRERTGLIIHAVAIAAFIFLAAGFIVHYYAGAVAAVFYKSFLSVASEVFSPLIGSGDANFAMVCVYSIALSTLLAPTLNLLLLSFKKPKIHWFLKANEDDHLEGLWYRAGTGESTPVAITLDSGKVYIGLIFSVCPDGSTARRNISILPYVSGYRKPDTKELEITTDYVKAISELDPDESPAVAFEIVIPVERIISASPFDFVMYNKFAPELRGRQGNESQVS